MDIKKRIGEQIKTARAKAGLTQEELAEKIDIKRTTISKIENGAFSATITQLYKFEKPLRIRLNFNGQT